ncbi:MAG: peptide ABC transporter substrate-binding protein [Parachlamydiales bacterium]|nr:peptide ABC transporter substrate-binding protein [Parachlamydiales bacterium]
MKNWIWIALAILTTSCSSPSTPHAKKEPLFASTQVMRLNLSVEPFTLDPRRARDAMAVNLCEFLYEGLMRNGPDGKLLLAAAEKMSLSSDMKVYTFTLRDSKWSNGLTVTAYDFEKTWKTSLSPSFPSDNAYLLFAIKNAKEAKTGKIDVDAIGVKALDEKTLQIELNNPTPYFTQLLTHPITFALPRTSSAWEVVDSDIIVNGPFKVNKWQHNQELTLAKNQSYWDADQVKLERVDCLMIKNSSTELHLFQDNQLDWVGSPLGSFSEEAIDSWKQRKQLQSQAMAGTYWLRVNVNKAPFDNGNLRRALALAINRKELIDNVLKGNQIPALGIVPPSMWADGQRICYFRDGDFSTAKRLMRDGLLELGLSAEQLPPMTLLINNNEKNRRFAQALQQQWKNVLGVDVNIQVNDYGVYLQNVKEKNFQICMGNWLADFNDATNFLEVFKYNFATTNNTNWENKDYTTLLDEADRTSNTEHRQILMQKAEKLLIEEMPVIPLYHCTFNYAQKDNLKGVVLSPLGFMDIKWAYIEEQK